MFIYFFMIGIYLIVIVTLSYKSLLLLKIIRRLIYKIYKIK